HHGIVATDGRFADEVNSKTQGANVILDAVGAAYAEENLKALALGGRIVVIGLMGGASGTFPFGALLAKRATIIGTTLRARPLEQKATLAQAFVRHVVPLFESGAVKPVVD